jgi:hypothetical protein
MRRGRTNPRTAHGGFGGFGKKYIVKRDNAGWKIRPEAADMADRKQFDRAMHGDFDLSDLTNARTAHDGPGTDLPKRGNDLLLPPRQRQWHRIIPARSTPRKAMALSTVFGSWIATALSVCSPRPRSLAAKPRSRDRFARNSACAALPW